MKIRKSFARRRPSGHVLPSIVLLCAPVAFQLAGAAQGLPDSMWVMLLLSLWSSLVAGVVLVVLLLRVLLGVVLARLEARAEDSVRA